MTVEQGGQSADYDAPKDSHRDDRWCGFCGRTHESLACPPRVIPPASPAPERDRAAEVEAAEDRAEQAAFDAARERP